MDAKNVTSAKPKIAGSIFNAPVGTALPENAVDELNAAFAPLGYVSEDGLTNANSPECENVKAWGGDIVLSSQTDKKDEFKFKLIEALNVNVLKTVYGDDKVTGNLDTGIAVEASSDEVESRSWVIDMILKGGILKRIVIPDGKISAVEEIPYKDNEALGYGITLTLVPDTKGNTHYEYIIKPTATESVKTETENAEATESTGE